jgi:hypothetical protein
MTALPFTGASTIEVVGIRETAFTPERVLLQAEQDELVRQGKEISQQADRSEFSQAAGLVEPGRGVARYPASSGE